MFGKTKVNTQQEDLDKLLGMLKKGAGGDISQAEAEVFHDPKVAEAYNDFVKGWLKANNLFVMRANATMTEIGDSSIVKNMIDEVKKQSEIVDTIHSSGNELENSVSNVQFAVQNIQQNSGNVLSTTRSCSDDIKNSIKTIGDTAREVEQINGEMSGFKVSAENITKIVDQIKDLADNSSLLALNASIEAARAGEAGRGFAVVAQQMGTLSNDTASCADSVVKYVGEMLKGLDSIAAALNDTSDHLQEGTEGALKSVENLDAMTERISDMNRDIDSIFEEVNTQSALTEEFIALGNTVASGFDRLNNECFSTGEHLFKISRKVDYLRSDMARQRSLLTMQDWITVFEVDHLIFTWRLYNHIVGFEHLKIEQVNNVKGCKLGKWLAAQTDSNIRGCSAFGQIQRTHEELHRHAVDCFKSVESGKKDEAMKHFELAYQTYQELEHELKDLHKQLRALGYSEETNIDRKV
jgi:phage host-nuclease inhibitor protein Gam